MMARPMRFVVACAAVLLLARCYANVKHVVRQNSTATIDPAARDQVFSKALQTIQRRGWIVAVSDRAGGVLSTQAMNTGVRPCGSLTCDSRGTLQITITETGAVAVNLHRELFVDFMGVQKWFVPTAEQDVAPIEAEQREILAEILGQPAQTPVGVR